MPAAVEDQKRAAAEAAVAEVRDGMLVGLGTGTTAAYAIAALAARAVAGLAVTTVATSLQTAAAAQTAGLHVIDFAEVERIDLCIDGVDEIDPALRAIKGGGGAMLREKIVASAADRMIAIADSSKPVARLGARPVPLEVLPFAQALVRRRVQGLGAPATLRMAGDAPYRTDQNNLVIDCAFGAIDDPEALASKLQAVPGVLGHGLFVGEIHVIYVGTPGGVERHEQRDVRMPVTGWPSTDRAANSFRT